MSATSNTANANQAQFGQFGQITVDSSNPYYCTPLARTKIAEVTNDGGGSITYELSGSPDLSQIVAGSKVIITNCPSNKNNGVKFITSVDDVNDTITVSNKGYDGVTETPTEGFLEIHAPKTVGIKVRSDLTISSLKFGNNVGGSVNTSGYVAGTISVGDIRELVVTGGVAELYLAPDYLTP